MVIVYDLSPPVISIQVISGALFFGCVSLFLLQDNVNTNTEIIAAILTILLILQFFCKIGQEDEKTD